MKPRPAHATDCPGCATGWVYGELLCPRCKDKVHAAQPTFYDAWLSSLTVKDQRPEDTAAVASEAYRRGLIVGTAMIMASPPSGNRRSWHYEITDKGKRLLETPKQEGTQA